MWAITGSGIYCIRNHTEYMTCFDLIVFKMTRAVTKDEQTLIWAISSNVDHWIVNLLLSGPTFNITASSCFQPMYCKLKPLHTLVVWVGECKTVQWVISASIFTITPTTFLLPPSVSLWNPNIHFTITINVVVFINVVYSSKISEHSLSPCVICIFGGENTCDGKPSLANNQFN